jgi:hypothetical protein
MADEIKAYCIDDVQILKDGCMKFRHEFVNSTKLDPFQHAFTIAGACMRVFRHSHLQPNIIGRIPLGGYSASRMHSFKALEWLKWMEHSSDRRIQHAQSPGGEQYLDDVHRWADGYHSDSKTVYLFHGCYYHGHITHLSPSTENKKLRSSMGDLYRETKRVEALIQHAGYNLIVKWECEWDKDIEYVENIRLFAGKFNRVDPILPRSALYGGRTDVFSLYKKADNIMKIKYVDIQSLYPYCCKTKKYPTGHPTVLTQFRTTCIDDYEGLIKCCVLPPTNLIHPVLPLHLNDKMVFILCYTCGKEKNTHKCTHTDRERAITATWVSDELHKAIEMGYQILEIYEIWHYKDHTQYNPFTRTGGIFTSYMDAFIKLKMESSGYPSDCKSDADRKAYIDRIFTHENVLLRADYITPNPVLRAVSKICLNSLWGKLSQKDNQTTKKYITTPADFYKLLNTDEYTLRDAIPIGEECIFVSYLGKNGCEHPPHNTNAVIASYVTAHARLELYKYLEMLGDRALYCDTDSVIYTQKPGEIEPLLTEYMGGMTDELNGETISEFVSLGVKNYGYRCTDGSQMVKVKGFTLTKHASDIITFDLMKSMVEKNDPKFCVNVTQENCEKS